MSLRSTSTSAVSTAQSLGLRLWKIVRSFVLLIGQIVRDPSRRLVSRLQDSPIIQSMARAGFVVNGLLHIIIGGIAIGIAHGTDGSADQGGAMASLAAQPGGVVVLILVVAGLWGLGIFQLLEAGLVRGTDGSKWADRTKEAGKGIAYLAIGSTAFAYTIGLSPDSAAQATDFTAVLLGTPGGIVLVFIVAIAVFIIGVYFVVKGIRRRFLRDIDEPTGAAGTAIIALGIFGYIAKGLALAVVGVLFALAAITTNADAATGLDGALKVLATLPFGVIVLTSVGAGFIAYGLYCFVRSRYARL